MAKYSWTTTWMIEAPLELVWQAIRNSEDWPRWWTHFVHVEEVDAGNAEGIGNRRRYTLKTRLPYRIQFEATTTRIEKPHLLEGAVKGEVEGIGRWQLQAQDHVTAVRYDWEVRTNHPLFDLLAPIASPIFKWNHHKLMLAGGRGLGKHLGAPFLGMRAG